MKCLIANVDVRFCARVENGVKQLIALITENGDIVLHYTFGDLPAVLKHIPWLQEMAKTIQALCFDTTGTWLLVVTLDGSLYIIPALSLVDKKQKVDCKWSVNDVTHFPRHPNLPDAKALCVVWWQTLDCNQNALVGYENGSIGLVSLTDGRCLGVCSINEAVVQLNLCHNPDTTFLLINSENGQQWRLVLEHRVSGYLWPPDSTTSEEASKSRLYNLKQMGVEKLASLRLKFGEGRHSRRNSQASDTNSESSHTESVQSVNSVPELLPHLCDTYFSAQHARNRYLFCAFYRPSSLLTVHAVDVDTAPLYTHKLPAKSDYILLTDRLIFVIDDTYTSITIISSQLSECGLEGDTEFNPDALIGQFTFDRDKERILNIFKVTDTTIIKNKQDRKDKTYALPISIDDVNIPKVRIDTCVVITNVSIYKITLSTSPVKKFITLINEDWNLIKAERVALVCGLNLHQLLEICGDLLIAKDQYHQGLVLYKQAKVHLLKRVLKLAVSADCKALLKYINLCLSSSKVDMSMATKIHIGNLGVMAHTEMVLRNNGQVRIQFTKDFMNFLCYEEYYDQVLAVNVACQAGHWNVVTLLAKCRGLQPEVVTALSQVILSSHSVRQTVGEFHYALSEPSLTQSLLIYPACSVPILTYIRNHVDEFSVPILKRFFEQLNPSQPVALPVVAKMFQQNRHQQSDIESTLDSIDYDISTCNIVVKDFIETFIMVVLHLIEKTGDSTYNINLLEKLNYTAPNTDGTNLHKFPPLQPMSCGYEHAAIIRNNNVYTMGIATSGCLGIGPLLTQSSAPKIVQTLQDLKLKALSVSCGRKHTLALTDYGVYAWGSNCYGQLGLGAIVQETPYPQVIAALSDKHIVDICCGQYHSLALTAAGDVYSWGWGIHGQLGHGNCDNQCEPVKLNFELDVLQISAGHAHSIILGIDGKIYGFGSNCFGQLGSVNVDPTKATTPVWILLMPEIYTQVEKISTAYFHNIAIRVDQEVFIWGANPQEVRIAQTKFSQKMNGFGCKLNEPWKQSHHIYSGKKPKAIEDVAAGYRHCAILHNGKLMWGRGREGDLGEARVREHDFPGALGQKFTHVSCGPDYIMALENSGKVLAWGSNNMAQTILGKPYEEQKQPDGKVLIFRNTKRCVKIPSTVSGNAEGYPIEVPGLPTMAINYNIADPRLSVARNRCQNSVFSIENKAPSAKRRSLTRINFDPSFVEEVPQLKIGQKTLHYVLEQYFGFYDSELILGKCLQLNNPQAASKVAILDGHYGDSLIYQLKAFKNYIEPFTLDLDFHPKAEEYDINALGELCPKSEKIDFNGIKFEFNALNSPAHILSTSSSLDSIRQWDDLDHQGGCESPCEVNDMGDIKQSMTQYVQSVKNDNTPTISSVSKLVDKPYVNCDKGGDIDYAIDLLVKDLKTKEVIKMAAFIIEYYIKKTYNSENHILMQNILLKSIEFWLNNNLPVAILEMVLLKNMDKYFYPLSILLFCKNFNNNLGDELVQNGGFHKASSAGFLKEFSTKFCLHLCSMVLENVNKA